jgi:hypothetical protein
MAKSALLSRDLEMLADDIEAPLETVKTAKRDQMIKKSVSKDLFNQGATVTKLKYGTLDSDVLDIARGIQDARDVTKADKETLAKAIRTAKSISQ